MAGERILITDDSSTARKSLCVLLENAGYQITEASNGLEALAKLKNEKYALLILDLQMPQMNGFEVLRIIKSGTVVKGLPVLCMTSVHTHLEDIHKLKDLGATGYINKDCSPEDLLFRIEKTLQL